MSAAPGDPSTSDPGEWALRASVVQEANLLLSAFYIDRDPVWIVRACEVARRGGITPPKNWLDAERIAKTLRRGRHRPANALVTVKLLSLAAIFWYRPSPGKPFGRRMPGKIERALARECGLSLTNVRRRLTIYGRQRMGEGLKPGQYHEDPARPRPRSFVIKARRASLR